MSSPFAHHSLGNVWLERCMLTSLEEKHHLGHGRCQVNCDTWQYLEHQILLINTHTPWPNEVRVGWLNHCQGIVWKLIWKQAHTQLVREHSATVVSAHWATVDWSWLKEWNQCMWANLHFKKQNKKVQADNERSNILPNFLLGRKEPPPPMSHHSRKKFLNKI